jgi:hypothetical protein
MIFSFSIVLALVPGFLPPADDLPATVRFNRDIRPLLSDNCFFCHGPDSAQRKADLRLDTKEGLLGKPGEAGTVVPGKPDMSDLVERLRETDATKLMPPPKSGKKLTEGDIRLIEKWVEQGAKFEGHWSFEPVRAVEKKPEAPRGNEVDWLISQKLLAAGVAPAPLADKRTLLRRLSFDLTGLPPSPGEMDAFLADNSPGAYERQVERLLASPRHAERLAMWWLDLVRYADSVGYHGDQPVSVHPYRRWVIDAFAANMPFDRFTVEQLAGDLLPNPTEEQRIASGYNRLGMMSAEGGVQPKEYLAKYIAERVRNVSGVWLGVTLGCAECHDHKYDPFTTRDFYRMEAFFADIKEVGLYSGDNWGPKISVPDSNQRAELRKLEERIAGLEKQAREKLPPLRMEWARSIGALRPLPIDKATSAGGAKLEVKGPGTLLASAANPPTDTHVVLSKPLEAQAKGLRLEVLPADGLPQKGPGRAGNGNFVLTELEVRVVDAKGERRRVKIDSAAATLEQASFGEKNPYGKWTIASAIDGDAKGKDWGWAILPEAGKANAAEFFLAEELPRGTVVEITLWQDHPNPHHTLGSYRLLAVDAGNRENRTVARPMPAELETLLRKEKRTAEEDKQLDDHLLKTAQGDHPAFKELLEARAARDRLVASQPTTLVTETVPPRMVRVLRRGNWMDESGELVTPGTPATLPPMAARGAKPDRLDLARWLVSPDNPLTARTTVNRLWKLFFGAGLSRNLEDLGSQGEWPTHPELLDALASRLVASGWNLRELIRHLVTSEAYQRQSSHPEGRRVDPDNRLLARQGRWRVDAEMVRDTSLAVSGLLVEKVGGPSVFPYQPAGFWSYLNFPTREWQPSSGDGLHRRSLYTHWQRQYLHPAMQAFDAPSREECVADRARSNTPLQSLVLLNDPIQVEAARSLANRVLNASKEVEDEGRILQLFRWAVQRAPEKAELETLKALLASQRAFYSAKPAEADKLLSVGVAPKAASVPAVEQAAWVACARALLNLHETITRE